MPGNLFDAHVSGQATELFGHSLSSSADRLRAVERARGPIAPGVLAGLSRQNARFGPSAARDASLAALADGAAVVVTGQQVGLFLGPLYTLYKAASAIRVARALSAESGRKIVPVFWLQSEDHDLPEIASCCVPRAQAEPLTLELEIPAENRVSIAHLHLPAAVSGCLDVLERELGSLPHAREHLDRLARHYRAGARWVDAFAGLLAELFEPEGLLLIDPRDAAFAGIAAQVHRTALEAAPELERALFEQHALLERAGFEPTVHVRADSPLSFFHAQGAQGPRSRLYAQAEGFAELGGAALHTRAAVLAQLERDPLCFSTSALLRPIVQDTLLPTAAYVGGPAEVAYFAQLPKLYAVFGRSLPLIVPRARFRLIEPACARLLSRLQLTAAMAAEPEAALLARIAAGSTRDAAPPEELQRHLQTGFSAALEAALRDVPEDVRAQLTPQIDKTREKLETSAEKLAAKYGSALLRREQGLVQDVQRLKRLLFPAGAPQERAFGLPYFAARYGERALVSRVLEAIEPFSFAPRELLL